MTNKFPPGRDREPRRRLRFYRSDHPVIALAARRAAADGPPPDDDGWIDRLVAAGASRGDIEFYLHYLTVENKEALAPEYGVRRGTITRRVDRVRRCLRCVFLARAICAALDDHNEVLVNPKDGTALPGPAGCFACHEGRTLLLGADVAAVARALAKYAAPLDQEKGLFLHAARTDGERCLIHLCRHLPPGTSAVCGIPPLPSGTSPIAHAA
jgi:hypothetical protein